jgi:chromosome segregation ATPase
MVVALGSEMDGSKAVQSENVNKNPVVQFSRVKRPERPSREDLNCEVSKVYEEINALQARAEEISSLVNGRHQGRNSLSAQIVDARKRLSELIMQFKSVLDEKKAIKEELDMADEARGRMRQEARSLRDKLPFVRVEEIDDEIKKIDYRIAHTSLTSQEEQRLIKQVSNLRKSRDFVFEYTAKAEKLSTDESSRSALLQKIKEKDQILNGIKKQQEEERKQIESLKEKENTQLSDIPALIEEKNAAFDKIKSLRDHISQLRNDFQLKEQEHWSKEKEWRQQQAMDRKQKFEKREAEWKEREEIRRQKQLENYVPPYTDELITCDQLFSYLQKFVPLEKEPASAPQQAETVSHKGFEDFQQIKKNQPDEGLGGWFSGIGSKGKPKKAKGSAGGKLKERISLSIDALASFQKVGLRAPSTVGDVPASLIELKAKKEQFLKRQSEESNPKDNGSDGVHDFVEENTEPVKESVDPSNSDDGQEENKDKSIDTSLVKDTTEELEAAHQDVIVASNGDNGVLNVPEVDIEEVIEVTNGDGIENKTVVELVEDQLL